MRKMTDENELTPEAPKPARKRKPKVKAKKAKKKTGVKAMRKAAGTGKYERKCALKTCRKPFKTDDARKLYHSRACGNKERSKRWYHAAAQALRNLRKKKR
jgi:hypothetical protein